LLEPSISIIIAAYNEAPSIIAKLRNLLSLDYPAGKLEILVGSDGSDDGTVEALLQFEDKRVRVFAFPARRGKPTVINTLVPRATGEIAVLCDVRQKFETETLRALVRSFADPSVGAVSGEVILTKDSGLYWRYETFIRSRESLVDSSIAVTGPIYAIRRELFEPVAADTLVEDLLVPLRIARRGFRVVVERDARATDDAAFAVAGHEFVRKVRTLAGNFQLFARERWLFNPWKNRLWWQVVSHKALRLLIAPLQVALFLSNVALAGTSPLYALSMLGQVIFYAGAIAGCIFPRGAKKPFLVSFPHLFCLLSWATVVAFFRSITRRQPVTWQKAPAGGTPR
jgi:cellulose synthase/poly-beta-1,6-N-acetylglucosamine synthase-like glycosyltransferase